MESNKKTLEVNPREKANVFSVLTFWWTIALFKKGYRQVLGLEDLFCPLTEDKSQNLGDRLEKHWNIRKSNEKLGRMRLPTTILRTFWWEYTRLGLIQLINEVVIRLGQPLLLGRLLTYFRKDNGGMTRDEALWCAGGIVILNALSILTINQYTLGGFHMGMKVRVAVCSVIYRKALRLSRTALGDTAPGKVVNLLSNDVNRFDMVSIFLHFMWSAPLMALVVAYLLWIETGWPGVVGVAVVFTVMPIQAYTSKLSSKFRLQTALRTDERVRLMDEVISGVQVIKMYAWEVPFAKLIAVARRLELNIVRKNSFVRGLYMSFLLFTTRMALFSAMLSIVLSGGQLTAAKVFVVASYFGILSQTMSAMFVRGIAELAETWVAMGRLQRFLDYDEFKHTAGYIKTIVKETKNNGKIHPEESERKIKNGEVEMGYKKPVEEDDECDDVVTLKDFTASWIERSTGPPTLDSITMKVPQNILIGVVGPVGAGKTSILQAILGELPTEKGSLIVRGTTSYASQEPWVFAGSVRQNILFGEPMEKERYAQTVKCCALLKDFDQFPDGDLTIVGERGASLSGGQRARISLARAIYRRADVYLLDDPLSAVDAHVGRHLFDECIGSSGRLGRCSRILVTHQVHYLKDADWIIIMKDGAIEIQGSPHDLASSGVDFAKLIGENELHEEDEAAEPERKSSSRRSSKSKSLASIRSGTSSVDSDEEEEEAQPETHAEASSKGTVKGSVTQQYFTAGANPFALFPIFCLFVMAQFFASYADYWVSFWTSQEELRAYYNNNNVSTAVESLLQDSNIFNTTEATIGNIDNFINDTIANATAPIMQTAFKDLLSTETCIYIHGGLMFLLFTVALTRSLAFYTVCVRASQKLHNMMFTGVIEATMRFFDTNPSGRILNRFSKDMGAIDEYLPKAILDATQIILTMFGAIIVSATVNPLFLVPVAFLSVIFMMVRRVYLKTSKNIKRLEGITRSPVFTHIGASLAGLSTIRAFGAQDELIKEFDGQQDTHSAAWYMFITTSTAFGFSLDLMCLVFIFLVTFSFLLLENNLLGDQVGLAITQAMALTGMMQWGIRQSAEVANQLMSVERVLEYKGLQKEIAPETPKEPPKSWPEQGAIQFKETKLTYIDGGEPVLRGLNLGIKAEEKVGIVGRTGAGKSSLIAALFRLAPIEGSIYIDGVETGAISLHALRSKISIIPQDPVLFSGTLRRNLDPFEEYPDAIVWTALSEVELKDMASGPLGLQSPVMAGGSNFSVGQRQLVCLARAIIRNNKVLVLDEATANVDPNTDALIQRTIRVRFAHCTVLTVAHRLHTIMDSDRVLVMDTGKAAEFDSPYNLLQNTKGIFSAMVEQTGKHESEILHKIAKEVHDSKNKEL